MAVMTELSREQMQLYRLSADELRCQLRALQAQVEEVHPVGFEREALQQQIAAIEEELCRRDEPI